MNKKFFIFLLFFANYVFAENIPEWIIDIDKFCNKNLLCATGNGNTLNAAKIDARNNIQKIFETKVNSKFANIIINDNDIVLEDTFNELKDETSGILNGVIINKTYNDGKNFYAMAILDKIKTAKNIEKEIDKIDEKMKILIQENSYNSSLNLEKLYQERENLNKKYLFLTGDELEEDISYRQVIKNKNDKKNNLPLYFIKVNEPYDSLESTIKDILVKNDLDITEKIDNSVKIVKADLKMIKDYINVPGFERYKININIDILKNGKNSGFIKFEFLETGRSKEQIYSKAIERIREYIEENFDEFIE